MSALVSVLDSAAAASVLLKPEHLKLLQLLQEPNSAAGLARHMGWSRQIAGYHFKELENAGLIALKEERKRGNCTERIMQRTAATYLVGPQVLGSLAPEPERQPDKLSASYLIAVSARIIREMTRIMRLAEKASKQVPTLTLETEIRFRNPEQRAAFTRELTASVAQLTAKYHDSQSTGGRSFRVLTAAYPLITNTHERKEDNHAENSPA